MKNIGIITFHNAHNYGAVLQAYALQEKIKKLGYNVKIIDYKNKNIIKQYRIIKYSKNPIKCIKMLFESFKNYKDNKKRYSKFTKFIDNKLELTSEYRKIKVLKTNSPLLDCYITGSDQVWNTNIVGELSDAYTLNFGDETVRRISYAASIGNSAIPKEFDVEYKEKISKIDYLSVREECAKKALQRIGINKNIKVVLDPTLLLTREEWDIEIKDVQNKAKEKYILAYVVKDNEQYYKIVNELSKKTGLKVIHFGKKNNCYKNVMQNAYTAGPFEFINLIKNAEYIVATSFHATIFSILYNKKFFIVPHTNTGSRVTDLLDKLKINNRTFETLEEFQKIDFNFETDYENVEYILQQEREKSVAFLKGAIEDKKHE